MQPAKSIEKTPTFLRATAVRLIAGTALFLTGSVSVMAAQGVTGELRSGVVVFKPTFAAAFPAYDRIDPRKAVVLVVLTDRPFDVDTVRNSVHADGAFPNSVDMVDANSIRLWIEADGTVSINALHHARGQHLASSPEELTAMWSANDGKRVAGTVRARQPLPWRDGETWLVDLTFDIPVSRPDEVSPLGATGGEPGLALAQLYAAIAARDWPRIKARLTPEEAERFEADYRTPAENLADAVEYLANSLPQDARVVGGELRGAKRAVLQVEGNTGQIRTLTLVEMVLQESGWAHTGHAKMLGMID